MPLPVQTSMLLRTARHIVDDLPADAVLLLTETDLDWDEVLEILPADKLLVCPTDRVLTHELQRQGFLQVLDIDAGPTPTQERMSLALLDAVAQEKLRSGAHVVALYNGIGVDQGRPEPIDTLSLIHLGEHLERLTAADLRKLDLHVPLEVLRAVVDLATEIGREGREGKPVGTMFVVGDTDKVMSMSRALNFNPFRGYSRKERDIRDRRVREQIKDLAQLEGAGNSPRRRRRGGVHVHRRAGRGHHAVGRPGHTPLVGGRHHQEDARGGRGGEPVVGECAHFPERHGRAAHHAAVHAADGVAPLPHGKRRGRRHDEPAGLKRPNTDGRNDKIEGKR